MAESRLEEKEEKKKKKKKKIRQSYDNVQTRMGQRSTSALDRRIKRIQIKNPYKELI